MPHRWRTALSLEAFRQRVASADALPQMALLGTLAGLLTGIVILLFRGIVHLPLDYVLPGRGSENFEALPPLVRFALVSLGGIAIGYLVTRTHPAARSVGVTHVIERLRRHQGHLPWRNAITQFVAGGVGLLTGQSGGREGPAIHLGAATSSLLGQAFSLPNNSIRTLVGCGTAAAIAGSFNTPLAGIVFAMEVVMLDYSIASFVPVILAAVTATLLGQLAFGDHTAFDVPDAIRLHGLQEIPFVIAEGIVIGALAAAFIWACRRLSRITIGTLWSRIVFAGLFTAAVSLAVPEVMGVGYDTVEAALDGELATMTLLLIAIAKLCTSAVTCGLRVPVGIIGPSLVIGAAAGGALGQFLNASFPALASDPALHVMLGMAAMMGATLHAPLAALLAVVELTGNPNVTLPAMLTIIIATLVARSVFRQRGIFVELLSAQGVDHDTDLGARHLDRVGIASAMERNILSLPPKVTLGEARSALLDNPTWIVVEGAHGPYCVLNPADLERHVDALAMPGGPPDATTRKIHLNEIPATRLDVVSIDFQATLREAWARLQRSSAEAVCVRRVLAPMVAPTLGVLTREACERLVRTGD